MVDAARAADRLRSLPPPRKPADRGPVGIVHLRLCERVGRGRLEQRQPAAGHADGAAQSARTVLEISRMSRRSSSIVGRPQNQYPSYARWMVRSGKSVKTAGTYGSLSVSVVSRRPSSAWIVRAGSDRNVHRAPSPARKAAETGGGSTLTETIREYATSA